MFAASNKQRCLDHPTHEISLQTKTWSGGMDMINPPAQISIFVWQDHLYDSCMGHLQNATIKCIERHILFS